MDDIRYPNSGALNRTHYALVLKEEQANSAREVESAIIETFNDVKNRMANGGEGSGPLNSLRNFAKNWNVHIPSVSAWNPSLIRENLLLLEHCRAAIGSDRITSKDLDFALPHAVTLAEAGTSIQQRRAGYTFCTNVMSPDHEFHLMLVNTLRKDIESSSITRITLALDVLITAPKEEYLPAIQDRLEDLLAHSASLIRQRVLLTFRALAPYHPDILKRSLDKLPNRLADPDATVKDAALKLLFACYQHSLVSPQDTVQYLKPFIRDVSHKHKRGHRIIAVQALSHLQVVLEKDFGKYSTDSATFPSDLVPLILRVAKIAAATQTWELLVASAKAITVVPLKYLANNTVHPLAFLRPLVRLQDANAIYSLLSCLEALPALLWIGTNLRSGQELPGQSVPNTNQDPFQSDFGPFQGSGSPAEQVVEHRTTSLGDIWAPLFEEDEVGCIIGFLNSDDQLLRRKTLRVLRIADADEAILGQYLDSLLQALDGTPPTQPHIQNLACRALDAADVMSAGDGTRYAVHFSKILSRAETSAEPMAGINSASGAKSLDYAVLDSVMDTVLTRLRDGSPAFQHSFTVNILKSFVEDPTSYSSRKTTITICASVACQYGIADQELEQNCFNAFSSILTRVSASIQEILLLVMIRLAAYEHVDSSQAVDTVKQVKEDSGRHMRHRCNQFFELIGDIPSLRKLVKGLSTSSLPELLTVIERTHATSPTLTRRLSNQRSSRPSTPQLRREPGALRYTAYESPGASLQHISSSRPSRRPSQTSFTGPQATRTTHSHGIALSTSPIKNLSPDMTDLSQSIMYSSRPVTPIPKPEVPRKSTKPDDLIGLESPFQDISSEPPFATKTRSPTMSPRLLASRPPSSHSRNNSLSTLSPGRTLSSLPPPGSNQPKDNTVSKHAEHERRFNSVWTQLASSPSNCRGWSEQIPSRILGILDDVSDFDVTVRSNREAEIKLQLQAGLSIGLICLKPSTDGGSLWSLRTTDPNLRKLVKQALD